MIPLNIQPSEKQELREDGALDTINVFATIQGEGPFAGTPAVFVRLAGCSLLCPGCDTNYTEGRKLHSVPFLSIRIGIEARKIAPNKRTGTKLVVLTGGEPLRQNIGPLCDWLLAEGYRVQIETNGTLYAEEVSYHLLSIVCSPKTPKIDPLLAYQVDAWKYILQAGQVSEEDGLPLTSLGMSCGVARPWPGSSAEVYVQPMDEQDDSRNEANLRAAVESCMKFGYRLSVQAHKIAGVP